MKTLEQVSRINLILLEEIQSQSEEVIKVALRLLFLFLVLELLRDQIQEPLEALEGRVLDTGGGDCLGSCLDQVFFVQLVLFTDVGRDRAQTDVAFFLLQSPQDTVLLGGSAVGNCFSYQTLTLVLLDLAALRDLVKCLVQTFDFLQLLLVSFFFIVADCWDNIAETAQAD